MTAVIDRPRRLETAATAHRSDQDGLTFFAELDVRSEVTLADYLASPPPAGTSTWVRSRHCMALAARTVDVHGMTTRHVQARQLLAGHLGVYDRCFILPDGWQLTGSAPGCPLTWANQAGAVIVDVVRTGKPSHPLIDRSLRDRLGLLGAWARQRSVTLAGVRVLSMAAPATSLVVTPGAGPVPLAESPLGARLAADPVPGTMVDTAQMIYVLATRNAVPGPAVAR